VTFADYDHDGDLDLYISNKPGDAGRNVMWRNNGNSTFTDVSAETAPRTEALALAWSLPISTTIAA